MIVIAGTGIERNQAAGDRECSDLLSDEGEMVPSPSRTGDVAQDLDALDAGDEGRVVYGLQVVIVALANS
jgi:hypothetical protein